MREIKFKVWDYQLGAWAKESEARGSMGFEFGVKDYYDNIAGERAVRWGFMQYTGLLDKNEKEIYEGDLIEMLPEWYDGDYLTKGFAGEVVFEDGMFCVRGDGQYDWISLDEVTVNNYEFKVIGNIHENKK
jgi:hypothetical protein